MAVRLHYTWPLGSDIHVQVVEIDKLPETPDTFFSYYSDLEDLRDVVVDRIKSSVRPARLQFAPKFGDMQPFEWGPDVEATVRELITPGCTFRIDGNCQIYVARECIGYQRHTVRQAVMA